jgi:signal transduction histidine kinase
VLSLRTRIWIGAVLWTIGLFIGAVLVSTALMVRYPRYPLYLHGTAMAYGTMLTIVVLLSLVGGLWQVRKGLLPLHHLRTRLSAVHAGRERRVEGRYPTEVQPLVDDLNALLAHRDEAVRRALAKAGDLAHGLKTPLAVLAREADRARAAGQADLATALSDEVERMRRQIDYHLAHARAAASGGAPGTQCAVLPEVEAVVRTLQRLHADRGVTIDVQVRPDHVVRVQREDLDEIVGNLLDNACKWAASRIVISSELSDSFVSLIVDDDGPGLPETMRQVVLQRGVRVDEAAPGTGLGLSIVRELAELYGGSIALDRSSQGGLRACLRLPVQASARL